jgi:hypothetical protein
LQGAVIVTTDNRMTDFKRSEKAHAAALVIFGLAFLAGGAASASAQTVVPATACDAALAKPDLHPQPEMPLEDGTIAFSYNREGSFVTGGGAYLSINVALTFPPGPNATIRVSALDEACGGANGSATVFTFTFDELNSTRNTVTYDVVAFRPDTYRAAMKLTDKIPEAIEYHMDMSWLPRVLQLGCRLLSRKAA